MKHTRNSIRMACFTLAITVTSNFLDGAKSTYTANPAISLDSLKTILNQVASNDAPEQPFLIDNLALFSEYFNHKKQLNDFDIKSKDCKTFFQSLPKTKRNYLILNNLVIKNQQVKNRYSLLQMLIEKLESLYPPDSQDNAILDLYNFAEFTVTPLVTNAIALYFIQHQDLATQLLAEENKENFANLNLLINRFQKTLNSNTTDQKTDPICYIELGIIPLVEASDIQYCDKDGQLFYTESIVTHKNMPSNHTLDALRYSDRDYLEQCLSLAPQEIMYEKLPVYYQRLISQIFTSMITKDLAKFQTIISSLPKVNALRQAILTAFFKYIQHYANTQSKDTFADLFYSLTDETLKYFCRYVYYYTYSTFNRNPQLAHLEYIDVVQTPQTWDKIKNINNQSAYIDNIWNENIDAYLPYIFDLISIIIPNIMELHFNGNAPTNIPPQIGNFVNLIQLSISNNLVTNIANIVPDFTNTKLTHLPPEIGNLINLKFLNLAGNLLDSLPAEIGNLVNLEILQLQGNHLTNKLPAAIGNLIKLTHLNLNDNELTSLPEQIGNLVNLKDLELGYNNLQRLPKQIWNLKNLETFYLACNPLKNIPEQIGNLVKLKDLSLYSTQLTALPKQIWTLGNLEKLCLSRNPLKKIPKQIKDLKNLTELSLEDNQLTDLPAEICNLIKLDSLRLDNNQLTSLPAEIGKLTKLWLLSLKNNLFNQEEQQKIKRLAPSRCTISFE